MKSTNQKLTGMIALMFLIVSFSFSQEAKVPKYITVTTMHWNMDNDDFDMDTWKSVEKEIMDKVTSKNEYILGATFYTHRFTPDNTEVVYVQAYESWEAIDKAGDRNAELAKEAWPDEDARKAFFNKQAAYYSNDHSDEIYATLPNAKPYSEDAGEAELLFVRKSHLAFPEDGSEEEFNATFKEYVENVFHKNEHIKAYYPNVHAWGSDKREFVEAFFVASMDGIDKMFKRNGELFKEHWADEAARKAMDEKAKKYFTGTHGDYIYTRVTFDD